MQYLKYCLLLIAISCLTYCEKDRTLVWVEHEIADCCNPWGDNLLEFTHEEMATSFLEQNKIRVFDTEIEDRGRQAICVTCCQCPTNMFVRMLIESDDLDKAATIEFLEE